MNKYNSIIKMLGDLFTLIFYLKGEFTMADEIMEYGPDLYTLVDEEGEEQTFELLDCMDYEGVTYYALVPYSPTADDLIDGDGELVILKADKDAEGEDMMVSIDDDEEFDKVGEIFLKRIEEIFEGEDDEEDDFE